MTRFRMSVLALTIAIGFVSYASAKELTIAIVNNGHMINMQKVAKAYTAETGVKLNWVSLEEGVLREQVTSDTASGGGQYYRQAGGLCCRCSQYVKVAGFSRRDRSQE